jgi:hypothetical protein
MGSARRGVDVPHGLMGVVPGLRLIVGGGSVPMSAMETALPANLLAETGRAVRALGGAVLTVGVDAVSVESRLARGELSCPACGGRLGAWGWARRRELRGSGGFALTLTPRRSRCSLCRVTHVLLPVVALLRRADLAEVIGAALAAKAKGLGARRIAALLDRPVETVRGWLRRFGSRAETVCRFFTGLLVDVAPDPVVPAAAPTVFADAVAAVVGAAVAMAARWPHLGEVPVWQAATAATRGRLLSPSWPVILNNTSRP